MEIRAEYPNYGEVIIKQDDNKAYLLVNTATGEEKEVELRYSDPNKDMKLFLEHHENKLYRTSFVGGPVEMVIHLNLKEDEELGKKEMLLAVLLTENNFQGECILKALKDPQL